MIETLLIISILAILLVLDLAVIAAQTACQESSYARLLHLRENSGDRADRAIVLYQAYPRVVASLGLILVLTRFLLAGIVLWVFFRLSATLQWWLVAIVLLAAGMILFLIEHGIAARARNDPERSMIKLSPFIRIIILILSPLMALPLVLSKESASQTEPSGSVTEDELKTLVDAGEEEGLIEQGERRMIYSVIDLGDTLAREIMVPRIDMLSLDVATPLMQAIDALLNSGHSRVPIYEDTVDNMLGLLYAKDLLRVWREGGNLDSLGSLLRPAYYIPEAKKVNDLLTEMQSQRIHLAIVVDEYGGIAGLVTLEDIVEEILGEIRDEYDQAEELPYQLLKNGDFLFQGGIDIDDFNETMNSHLVKEDADTLGGYIYSRLGHVPEVGEAVEEGTLRLIVEQVSARRIRKVRARWQQPESLVKEEKHNDHG